MTADTPPASYEGWEPVAEGVSLTFKQATIPLPMIDVQELRADAEEAWFLAHGKEKVDCLVEEIQDGDWIVVLGGHYKVTNVLTERIRLGGENYVGVVLQFEYSSYSPLTTEVSIPADTLVSVYREIV